ncbi:beta-ketoacyl-ACP synthase II [Erysipelothrix sp. HDW6C]|uniref:beta-ketoacyl-ACP synthase II n=1 Tax=Erysipelothrix sp. HDW6C TaxID=2714930 RepID=UPI00140E7E48|nr:beta-ketoacyl-ACP synthase II [Erysipelothrix sp. HDW6C]QIK69716.1 beta-ketoacyl-ACP synthase II [Erysipelothrix sp. HDW6C]
MRKRVVVTGLGIVSPLGNSVEEAYTNAINGVSGVDTITSFDTSDLKVKVAAQVKNFAADKYLSKREIRRQDLFSQFAVYAASEAYNDAGLNETTHDIKRIGVLMGTGMGGMQTFAGDLNKAYEGGFGKIPPMFIPMIIPNMAAGNVAIALQTQGHTSCVTTACAAATHAIGDAFRMIQHGYADIMVAGGTEAGVSPYTLAGFNALTALSSHNDPKVASRPFDQNRDGFVLGEGAGVLILEDLEHAQKRGAHIYAEMVGYGSTCDAFHITAPSGVGAADAMRQALDDAGLKPEDVSYINAHGTSTPLNDKFETQAIKDVFQDAAHTVSISSTKSMHGHALGGTGGIEAVLSIKTITEGIIPPTINLQTADPECDLDFTPNTAKQKSVDVVMSNSLGFGGHNAVIMFRKFGV